MLACTDGSSLLWLTAGLGGGENARRLLFLKGKNTAFSSYFHISVRFIKRNIISLTLNQKQWNIPRSITKTECCKHVKTKFTPKRMKKKPDTFCNSPHCHEVMYLFHMTDVTSSVVREI